MKSHWIPCNRHHYFGVLNRMSWLFMWLLFRKKPDMNMVQSEIESGLAEGENELPFMMFDRQGRCRSSFEQVTCSALRGVVRLQGTQ
jgi:hypothetical protein